MTASDRVNIIRNIAATLGQESWEMIDLTLRQFDLPWTDSWSGNGRENYIIDMISSAEDQPLIDVAKHLGVVTELESPRQPRFWEANQTRIFISHLATEKRRAHLLKTELEHYGVACFVAHQDIEPTAEWQTEIEIALTTMDAFIAVLTPGFTDSKWCDQEIGVAIGRKVPIVPIKAGIDPYGFIGKYQALQGAGRHGEDVARETLELLAVKPQVAFKISNGLVERLAKSGSWAQSKRLMDLIEKCHQFSPDALERLRSAVDENSQVRDAWGVPDRIKQVLDSVQSGS